MFAIKNPEHQYCLLTFFPVVIFVTCLYQIQGTERVSLGDKCGSVCLKITSSTGSPFGSSSFIPNGLTSTYGPNIYSVPGGTTLGPNGGGLSSFGPFWSTFGPNGPQSTTKGPFGPVGSTLGPNGGGFSSFGPFGSTFRPNGPQTSTKGPFGPGGTTLGPNGGRFSSLGPFGSTFGPNGPQSSTKGPFGPGGTTLGPKGGGFSSFGPGGEASTPNPYGHWSSSQSPLGVSTQGELVSGSLMHL